MTEINLLAFGRWKKYPQALWLRFLIGGVVFLGLLLLGAMFYYRRSQSHLAVATRRVDVLQQEIDDLKKLRLMVPVSSRPSLGHPVISQQQMIPPKPIQPIQTVLHLHYTKVDNLLRLLNDKSNALLSKQGHVIADARTNQLWIEDTPSHTQKIMSIVEHLDVPMKQIVIEARLVNINQESARDLGIRLGLTSVNSGAENTPPTSQSGGRVGMNLAATPIEAAAATLGLTEALTVTQRLLDIELSALESSGRARVIASPHLITSNQVAAVIESGEDIPYQEFSANGTTSVAFKKAVLRLKVTPQMTARHELMMALEINQDSDSGKRVQGVPIISTKAIETHILVRSGQTIMLGGIYQHDQNGQAAQVPILGNIPWVNILFKRRQLRLRHESLLIFITPKVVA